MAFGLKNNLYVGSFAGGNDGESGWDISNLHFDFEISRSIVWFENYAKFKIYNASLDTVNKILYEGAGIMHECGYEDEPNGIGTLFVGNITKAFCEKVNNDVITHITATSTRGPEYQLVKVPIALSFSAGADMLSVLKAVSEWTAMPLQGAESLSDVTLDDDFSFCGSVNACMKKINSMLNAMGCGRMYFDNSMLCYIDDSGDSEQYQTLSVVKLDYSSGLVSASPIREQDDGLLTKEVKGNLMYYYFGGKSPVATKVQKVGKGKNAKKVAASYDIDYKPISKAAEGRLKIKFRSLVNPGLVPNTRVSIDNTQEGLPLPSVKGEFLIRKVKFTGNNYGGRCEAEGEAIE